MSAKPYDIQWPLTPQRVEDINANFDAIWRAVSLVPSGGGSGGGGVSSHDLLSAVHLDTTPGVVVRGDLIIGAGVTPSWTRLAKGTAGYVLTIGANEPSWAVIPTQTSVLLSATHTDTTPAAAVRGDVIVAQGVSPVWARLAKGTSGYAFIMGAAEPAWTAIPTQTSALLSATHTDTTAAAVVRGDLVIGSGASPLWTRLAAGAQYAAFQMGATEPAWQTNPRFVTVGIGIAAETGATAAVLKIQGAYYEVPNNFGDSGAAKTIDWILSNAATITLTAAPCTLTFSNPKTGGRYILELVQDGTGARTVVWPGTVIWNNGIPPSLTSVPGGIDLIAFYYDGTSYVGAGSGVGGGTVTSVGLSLPAQFTVSGSPVLASGTITAVWATQSANQFLAGPSSGGAAAPTFRSLVTADLPAMPANVPLLEANNIFTAANNIVKWSSANANYNYTFLENTTSGAAAQSFYLARAGTSDIYLQVFSQGFTTSTSSVQDGGRVVAMGVGGLSIEAANAAGAIRFYTGGATIRLTLTAAGVLTFAAIPAFVAADKYLVVDATGNVHVSALGPVA